HGLHPPRGARPQPGGDRVPQRGRPDRTGGPARRHAQRRRALRRRRPLRDDRAGEDVRRDRARRGSERSRHLPRSGVGRRRLQGRRLREGRGAPEGARRRAATGRGGMTVAPSQLPYPETRTEEVVEELAGVRFPDPYRWLEEDSDEVRAWQARQAEVASAYVRDWPDWSPLRALVERYAVERFPTVPRFAGGVWFREQRGQVVVADEPYGDGRALVTIADYKSGDDAPVLTWLAPSPDARVLAIGVCTDGSEHNSVHLIDVASGRELADAPTQQLHDGWVGGAIWLPDSSGFYFLGLVGPPHEFQQRVFFHRL